jgi:pimeloyl-ACP methyl ester carboxylesterase
MTLPWGFTPDQVTGPVHLWLGEHDQLVPPRLWLDGLHPFPACQTTAVPDSGHFLIAEHMTEILRLA